MGDAHFFGGTRAQRDVLLQRRVLMGGLWQPLAEEVIGHSLAKVRVAAHPFGDPSLRGRDLHLDLWLT